MYKIENLKFAYKNNNFILENINLEINKNDFLCILAPNGTGKSTLLKLISKINTNYSGNIFYNNKNIKKINVLDYFKEISFIPDKIFPLYDFTCYEIVAMSRYPFNRGFFDSEKNLKEKVKYALNLTKTYHLKDKNIYEISSGEFQRVLLASALCKAPQVIILDEPTVHLDIKNQIYFYDLLKKLYIDKKITIITVEHNLQVIKNYSENILMLKNKNIFKYGKTKELLNKQIIEELFDFKFKEEILI